MGRRGRRPLRLCFRKIPVQHGHGDGHAKTLFAVFGCDGAVVTGDDLPDDGKADANAVSLLIFGAVKAVEEPGQLRRGDTAAVVLDGAEKGRFCPFQIHINMGSTMLTGIFQKIEKCFPQPFFVTADDRRAGDR